MGKKVGIRFRPAGKIYKFDAGAFVLSIGDQVIVETKQGLGYGVVVTPPGPVGKNDPVLQKVYRLANDQDAEKCHQNQKLEQRAHDFCQECIGKLKLEMNLFQVECSFDHRRLTFFFTADGRVDFRQLIKLLSRELKVRIEMRQVGIRNQAKLCGGMGRCGREFCCSTYMGKFEPVSIRMAKEQGLSLNPTKISGVCGRLMCCLTYENETYRKLKKNYPKPGKIIHTPHGDGKVIRNNIMGKRITVRLKDGRVIETPFKAAKNKES